jgi:ribosomal protein S18 acetylase RimI-like enzyme
MALRLERQGRGVGRRLLEAARRFAEERRLVAMTLTTFRDVPWNGPFYERAGFREVAPEELGPRLKALLRAEVAMGMPGDQRCAMKALLSNSTPRTRR